jgi:alkylation response protein AidB-like acyl-CoA dehydrogenase
MRTPDQMATGAGARQAPLRRGGTRAPAATSRSMSGDASSSGASWATGRPWAVITAHGRPHSVREPRSQFPDASCVHTCTQADLRPRSNPTTLPRMNFAFTEEQEELRSTIRAFLEAKSPESAVREQMETEGGYDAAVWTQMAEQMGLQGLAIPEEYGGSGFGYVELGIVLEEMGRALLCAPFFSSVVLAANALIHSGDDAAKAAHLPGIASGETIATLAFTEPSGKWDEAGITAQATAAGDGYTISGTKSFVIDGHTANLLIVAARTANGVSLFTVDGGASGITKTPLSTMDQTRKQAKLEFDNTPATLLGAEGKGWDILSTVLDLAAVGLAAEQVGGAQFVLEMAVQYAKDRVQFGRPIGSFQAIKHKCADMLLEVESAKSAAYYGLWCAAEMNDELPSVASLAKAYCSEAYFHATAENIQIHGGIGFTWEHPAHLYFKRAKSSELLFGDPTYHRELLAQRIGI